ncbi:MAG: bifunctional diaminohydroxyphosphoribosylaminopyrimidine deaminase/5-amino-6-(5-phosphoribosylamino)uracil reductase RibD [Deltaproteobacteria bacterium]|nr:bifunctional diaminohydroxyphosphoribosylaminopyrimidine deaminase/5-amino-6-(5-phosphoribosylamino)uracil reductase RibD [Deltaproteobacteria bacterium]
MTGIPKTDKEYMRLALQLARKAWGRTSPNPMVGAVVVREHSIVGRGYHAKAGKPHAERIALEEAGEAARGATLYVTLEPCNHYGRTPPCTQAVLDSGVRRVVIGQMDPNPAVRGGGAPLLRERGIEVTTGVLELECAHLNEAFTTYVTQGRPFLAIKVAASLDGKIATSMGDSKWVTNERSRNFVHKLRAGADAIMVGRGTVMADDPQLTCRRKYGSDPIRVILDSGLNIRSDRKVFNADSEAGLIVFTRKGAAAEKIREIEAAGSEVIQVTADGDWVSFPEVISELARRKVTSVLIEGGSRVAASALRSGLADKIYFFYAPKIIGGKDAPGMFGDLGIRRMADGMKVYNVKHRRFGDDLLLEGYLRKPLPA